MKNRGIRRSQEQRMKNRAKRILKRWGIKNPDKGTIGHIASTHGKPCSCEMCRNPRHSKSAKPSERITLQEKRINDSYEQD